MKNKIIVSNQEYYFIENINKTSNGIILVLQYHTPIGYITYNGEWQFNTNCEIDLITAFHSPDLNVVCFHLKNHFNGIQFEFMRFQKVNTENNVDDVEFDDESF